MTYNIQVLSMTLFFFFLVIGPNALIDSIHRQFQLCATTPPPKNFTKLLYKAAEVSYLL